MIAGDANRHDRPPINGFCDGDADADDADRAFTSKSYDAWELIWCEAEHTLLGGLEYSAMVETAINSISGFFTEN